MIEREAADRRKSQSGFKSAAGAEGPGKRCPTSHVCTRSLTSGYEEIRLGSYPIVDKNKSHIHPALFSLLTVTRLRDNTAQVTINQAACLSFSRSSCTRLVSLSHFPDRFLTSRHQRSNHTSLARCFSTLLSLDWLDLKI